MARDISLPFSNFMARTSTEEIVRLIDCQPECLADFVQAWLLAGYGVNASTYNFGNFTGELARIVYFWARDPGITDFKAGSKRQRRRVSTIFDRKSESRLRHPEHIILEQSFFERCVRVDRRRWA